ncbi:hypothetical protein PDJAM_G00174650 [Pangasius djambal]|uniref:Uncharacterized protein n=1 Tax=Pangasius djambal TaxID=1691987 RepID=A0ACC5ZN32_9TELE|nr:hypothetical protein [Pangasius djambal]
MVSRINEQAMILIYIASVLACSAAEFSIVVPNASVSAPLGSSVVLPCGLSPSLNARTFEVRWSKHGEHDLILLYQDQKVQENVGKDQYRDRVSLIGELDKGNVSLKLDNLTVADRGEYICFVKSISWYEKGSMNLVVKALGSTPLFLHNEVGEKVNITCMSGGWSPKPTLTWRDSAGRELPNSHTYYRTNSEGLVSVSSWLLFSPSDSEWISCTVGLNHQEIREGRIVPLKGFWREAFISTLVLSLIVLSTFTVLLILFRKGLLPHCSSHKNAKAAADSHVSLPAETVPLNATDNATQADPHESLPRKSVPLNAAENTNQYSSIDFSTFRTLLPASSPAPPVLKDLHWLPIPQRIQFKLLTIVYKSLHTYLSELLHPHTPTRALRSADANLLSPPTRTKHKT